MRLAASKPCATTTNNLHKEKIYMPRDSRPKASQFHRGAAYLAATQHGKQDYQTGRGQSRQALEHSAKAFSESQEAHQKSATRIGKVDGSAEVTYAE